MLDALKDTEGQDGMEGKRCSCPARCGVYQQVFCYSFIFDYEKGRAREKVKTGLRRETAFWLRYMKVLLEVVIFLSLKEDGFHSMPPNKVNVKRNTSNIFCRGL